MGGKGRKEGRTQVDSLLEMRGYPSTILKVGYSSFLSEENHKLHSLSFRMTLKRLHELSRDIAKRRSTIFNLLSILAKWETIDAPKESNGIEVVCARSRRHHGFKV